MVRGAIRVRPIVWGVALRSRCTLTRNRSPPDWRSSLKTPRTRPLRAVILLAVLGLAALVAGCGGGGSSSDAKNTVKDAFSHSIHSAVVNLQLTAKIDGIQQLQQPVTLKLTGPYQ